MRRALAAAILGISFWIGSLAWTGFVLTRTVLDPGRSEDVAQALYDDDAVRAQLAQNIADAIEVSLPDGVDVPRPVLEQAATDVLDSPAVEAVFVDALVRTHAAFLGEGEAPDAVEAGAFGTAARQAVVDARPELDGVLPPAPELRIPLPTDRVPNFGPVRDVVVAAVPILAGIAGAGALLALLISSNRPAVIRRAGFWGIGLSAAVLVFAYGIPALAERVAPDQSQIVAALVGAMAAATRGPALALAATGLGAIGLSFIWKAAPSLADVAAPSPRQAAAAAGPAGRSPGATAMASSPAASTMPSWTRRRDLPTPGRRPVASTDATAAMPVSRPPDPDGYARRPSAPAPDPHPGYPSRPPSSPAPSPSPQSSAAGRRWVDGVGWVLDPAEAIPADARWVPGVGYVVDS